ncbi:MAG: hypothetical protein RL291_1957 [Pseudomonadota bacterium]
MKEGPSSNDIARSRALWRASLLALAGVAVSMALSGGVALALAPGIVRLTVSSLVLALALTITGFVVWSRTRALAGDVRRLGLVAVLAFLAVHDREWLNLFGIQDPVLVAAAQFLLTFVAFCFAMLVFMWLAPIDSREAEVDRAARS